MGTRTNNAYAPRAEGMYVVYITLTDLDIYGLNL